MYRVMVHLKFGIDDTYDCEYSGIVHDTKEQAQIELVEAEDKLDNNANFIWAYIEEV